MTLTPTTGPHPQSGEPKIRTRVHVHTSDGRTWMSAWAWRTANEISDQKGMHDDLSDFPSYELEVSDQHVITIRTRHIVAIAIETDDEEA